MSVLAELPSRSELIMCHVFPSLVLEDLAPPGQPRLQLPLEHVAHISSDKPLLVPIVESAQISAGRIPEASHLVGAAVSPESSPPPVVVIVLLPAEAVIIPAMLAAAVWSALHAHIPPDVPGPVLGCPDLLLPPDVEVDVGDGDPGPGGGLVVQCARAALKHPVRCARHELVVLVVEEPSVSDPAVCIAAEHRVELPHGMHTHQRQALPSIEAERSIVVADGHLAVAVIVRMVLCPAGEVLLELSGCLTRPAVTSPSLEHGEGRGGERVETLGGVILGPLPPPAGGSAGLLLAPAHVPGVGQEAVQRHDASEGPEVSSGDAQLLRRLFAWQHGGVLLVIGVVGLLVELLER